MKKIGVAFIILGMTPSLVWSHGAEENMNFSARPDAHAPIGVMGDHRHKQGEFMISYRYGYMDMKGFRSGTTQLQDSDLYEAGYAIAPVKMSMQMHMLGLMYAPSDRITLMGMVPYMQKDMDHRQSPMMGGRKFTTRTDGFGDIKLSGMVGLWEAAGHKIHATLGVSAPTGSINQRGDTLLPDQPLPYGMQMGSGTWDLLSGLTYVGYGRSFSWGAQASAVVRTGTNDNGYRLGDIYKGVVWIAHPLSDFASASVRLDYTNTGSLDGADERLGTMLPRMVPTADPNNSGGDEVDVSFGLNLFSKDGALKGHRLAVEIGVPVYRDLNGLQMEKDYSLMLGWQKAF
ncbi:transporter [Emcibacter sp.]|uniref:transporter n=1 Tax=Emcibacter sp. TaxID=1979954 RepID=UPI003A8D8B6C